VGAIVEYGLITVAVFLLIIYHIMKSLYKKYKKTGGIVYFTVFVSIMAWLIMGLTQLTGTSKPTWFIVQMLALGDVLSSRRLIEQDI
jgi:O-antigen ligase